MSNEPDNRYLSDDTVATLIQRLVDEEGLKENTIKLDIKFGFGELLVQRLKDDPKLQDQEHLTKLMEPFGIKRSNTIKFIKNEWAPDVESNVTGPQAATIDSMIQYLCAEHDPFYSLRSDPYECLKRVVKASPRYQFDRRQGLSGTQELNTTGEISMCRRTLKVLLLGMHDDVEICLDSLRNRLGDLNHIPRHPTYRNRSDPELTLRSIDETILRSTRDAYVVVVGRTYGVPLNIDGDDPNSIRHHEMAKAFIASIRNENPVLVIRADPGSELDEHFKKAGKRILEQRYDNDLEMIREDRRKLSRIDEMLQLRPPSVLLGIENPETVDGLLVDVEQGLQSFENKGLFHEDKDSIEANNEVRTHDQTLKDDTGRTKKLYDRFRYLSNKNTKPGLCLVMHSEERRLVHRAANHFNEELYWQETTPDCEDWRLEKIPAEKRVFNMLRRKFGEFGENAANDSIDQLAEFLVAGERSCMLVLKDLPDPKPLVSFHEKFWRPLYKAIEEKLKTCNRERWAIINIVFCITGERVDDVLGDLCNKDTKKKELDYEKYVCLRIRN